MKQQILEHAHFLTFQTRILKIGQCELIDTSSANGEIKFSCLRLHSFLGTGKNVAMYISAMTVIEFHSVIGES